MDMRSVAVAVRNWPLGMGSRRLLPNPYVLIVSVIIAGALVALVHGTREMGAPLAELHVAPVTLDPLNLPEYALRTTVRMFAAILASLVFTFVVATVAAKSRKAELVVILAPRSTLRRAGPHLEYDDVDVGRLVLRGRVRSDLGRRRDDTVAGNRLVARARDRAPKYLGGR